MKVNMMALAAVETHPDEFTNLAVLFDADEYIPIIIPAPESDTPVPPSPKSVLKLDAMGKLISNEVETDAEVVVMLM